MTKNPSKQLAAIQRLLSNDVDAMSDENLRAEAAEEGVDINALAERMRSGAFSLIADANRRRLDTARMGVANMSRRTKRSIHKHPPLSIIKQQIQELFSREPSIAIAYRKGEQQGESDWISLWDDLQDLGLLRDGNSND